MRQKILRFCVLPAVIALDQATKTWMLYMLSGLPGQTREWIPGILRLSLVENRGIAFGVLQGQWAAVALPVMTLILVPLLWRFLPRSRMTDAGAQLVLAGGISNLLDRLFRGYVVDFLETVFVRFPVFNIADIAVTCGIILMAIALLAGQKKGEKHDSA